jgi:RNA polymerase sigma factor (sigma-70 family)
MNETGASPTRRIGPAAVLGRGPGPGRDGADALVVSVASESRLVAESVTAALVDAGVDAAAVLWREPSDLREAPRSSDEVAVLISDLTLPRVDDVCAHGQAAGGRWLVITDAPRGPVWGAALDGGARAVVEATISIDGLIEVLFDVRADVSPIGEVERRSLLRQWWEARQQQELLRARMSTLTPRENEVLGLLYQGKTVRLIAARLKVSESTVRSQVKSVLRKLAVPSQIAAVATLDELRAAVPRPRAHG